MDAMHGNIFRARCIHVEKITAATTTLSPLSQDNPWTVPTRWAKPSSNASISPHRAAAEATCSTRSLCVCVCVCDESMLVSLSLSLALSLFCVDAACV